MRKKFFVLILSVMMASMIFTGCKKKDKKESDSSEVTEEAKEDKDKSNLSWEEAMPWMEADVSGTMDMSSMASMFSGMGGTSDTDKTDIIKDSGSDYPDPDLECNDTLVEDGKPKDDVSTVKINDVEYAYSSGGHSIVSEKGTYVLFITRVDGEDITLTQDEFDIDSNDSEIEEDITLDNVLLTDSKGENSSKIKAIVCSITVVKPAEGFSELEFKVVPKGEGSVSTDTESMEDTTEDITEDTVDTKSDETEDTELEELDEMVEEDS